MPIDAPFHFGEKPSESFGPPLKRPRDVFGDTSSPLLDDLSLPGRARPAKTFAYKSYSTNSAAEASRKLHGENMTRFVHAFSGLEFYSHSHPGYSKRATTTTSLSMLDKLSLRPTRSSWVRIQTSSSAPAMGTSRSMLSLQVARFFC